MRALLNGNCETTALNLLALAAGGGWGKAGGSEWERQNSCVTQAATLKSQPSFWDQMAGAAHQFWHRFCGQGFSAQTPPSWQQLHDGMEGQPPWGQHPWGQQLPPGQHPPSGTQESHLQPWERFVRFEKVRGGCVGTRRESGRKKNKTFRTHPGNNRRSRHKHCIWEFGSTGRWKGRG